MTQMVRQKNQSIPRAKRVGQTQNQEFSLNHFPGWGLPGRAQIARIPHQASLTTSTRVVIAKISY
jgi:hypothetical protein